MSKASQLQVGYVPYTRSGNQCQDCEYFRNPNGCTKVSGIIAKEGWCSLFEPLPAKKGVKR